MLKDSFHKNLQTPLTPEKQDFSYLSKLPKLFSIEGGNQNTIIQVIGKDPKKGPKYVKKRIIITTQNLQFANCQRSMMNIINSPYVLKLLFWQEKYDKNQEGKIPNQIILYMEYCENGDLESYLINQNPSIGERIEIFLDILYAMRFLHQKFILHRDIKLQNIFVTGDKKIKIGDLGFSSQKVSLSQTKVGTFGYMAPEVYFKTIHGYSAQKADVWSIGYMGYQILNKPLKLDIENQRFIRNPFMKLQLLKDRVEQIQRQGSGIQGYITLLQKKHLLFIEQIPRALKQLISLMLMPNPAKRISFRQIYENEYLSMLQLQLLNYEQFGQDKVYDMNNLVEMIRNYAEIYYIIDFNKQKMLDYQLSYELLYSKLYQKLSDQIILGGKLMQINNQKSSKACLLFFLTMRRLKAIYDSVKSSDFFILKNKLEKYDTKISNCFLAVKNQTQIYLRKIGKKSIDQNKEIHTDSYFKQLALEVSLLYKFDLQELFENKWI